MLGTETYQNRVAGFGFVLAALVCGLSSLWLALDVKTEPGNCDIELENRINPNFDPVASLIRLPAIGYSRAEAIIEYRKGFVADKGMGRAFENYNDLQKIHGIGPKTVENIRQWLKFE